MTTGALLKSEFVQLWQESDRWRSMVTATVALGVFLIIKTAVGGIGSTPSAPQSALNGQVPSTPSPQTQTPNSASAAPAAPTPQADVATATNTVNAPTAAPVVPTVVAPVATPPMRIAPSRELRAVVPQTETDEGSRTRPFATISGEPQEEPAIRILD